MTNKKRVEVAVGVILRDSKVFLTKRANNTHQGGKWEFPGGKKESTETIEQALIRELQEEVDIRVTKPSLLLNIRHDYPDKSVSLDVFVVEGFDGEPSSQEGLLSQWVDIQQLSEIDFPEANKPIVEKLNQLQV